MIRNDMTEVMKRVKDFNNKDKGTLIQIKNIKELSQKTRPLNSFNLPDGMKEYLDYRTDNFVEYWEKRKNVNDDLIPAIAPWYGIAEHTAFIGGDVDISEITSWHHPLIKTWDDLKKLSLDENNKWLRLVLDGLYYMKEKAKGQYAVKLRGGESAMDIANVLRGNDMFYDFYEYPDELRELLDFCTEAALFMLKKQAQATGRFEGGIITGFDIWLPGNSTGQLSEDASVMISKEHFMEFGIPYTERITKEFDHVFMHTHSLGIHNIPLIADITNIDTIEISNDPNALRAIEVYKQLEDELKNKTVIISPTMEELKDNLMFLSGKKSVIWYYADTVKEAEEAIKIVRDIS